MDENKDNENQTGLFDVFDTQEEKLSDSIEYEVDIEDASGSDLAQQALDAQSSENPEASDAPSEQEAEDDYVNEVIPTADIAELDENYMNDATVVSEDSEGSYSTGGDYDVDVGQDVDGDFSGNETAVSDEEVTSQADVGEGELSTKEAEDKKEFLSFNDAKNLKGGKNSGKKPDQLNKKMIVYVSFGIFMVFGLFMIFKPESWTIAKKEKKEKPVATRNVKNSDYESSAKSTGYYTEGVDVPRPDFTIEGVNNKYTEVGAQANNSSSASNSSYPTDPRAAGYSTGAQQQSGYYGGNGGGGGSGAYVEIPDTRNDRLQGKSISGIKGLTSTQETYATEYNMTKELNAAKAAADKKYTGERVAGDPGVYADKLIASMKDNGNSYVSQNDQAGKNSFYSNGRGTGGNGTWLGLNTIWQGTVFEVVTTSEINTDLPGEVTARVAKNVYSSQDGRYLLIPQNSVLIGQYNSSISYAQSRAQVIWHTLIRPDGYQINLGGMNGADTKGAAGIKGFVNDHPLAYVKAIVLMSAFGIANAEFQATMGETQNQYVQNVAANAQQMTNELGQKLIDRAMDVQPTIVIKAGKKMNVVVNQNLSLPAVERIEVTQKYQKGKLPRELY